ncbi:hypothetical protein [Mobiluncus mulieris]|nr:Abi family protein [Mobiluncus mulieris]
MWVIIEFFSTGMLSFTYADLKRQDRKRIARVAFNTRVSNRLCKWWLS